MSTITSRAIIRARRAPQTAVTVFSVGTFAKSFVAAPPTVGLDSPVATVKVIATQNYVPASWHDVSVTQDRIHTMNQPNKAL